MRRFHKLQIAAIERQTADAVCIAFAVPDALKREFAFAPGQYLTLRRDIDGADVRRSYSICSSLDDAELRVAVKKVPGGAFSGHANDLLKAGETVEVMAPQGRFTATPQETPRRYVAFAAGSGITPILSLARTLLAREPRSRFQLFYGNRTVDSIMFREALEDIKNANMTRFAVTHILSREKQDFEIFNGRLDEAKVVDMAGTLFDPAGTDLFFLCGPGTMIEQVSGALQKLGVAREKIKFELFATPEQPARTTAAPQAATAERQGSARITVVLDGVRHHFPVPFAGDAILDAGIKQGIDLPFSCKGGVCSTCRCKARLGQVRMDKNYALEPWETEAGFVLACQSHPLSDEVVLDFDEA